MAEEFDLASLSDEQLKARHVELRDELLALQQAVIKVTAEYLRVLAVAAHRKASQEQDRQRNMTTVHFVTDVMKRYLAGNSLGQPPLGLCPICKRRRLLLLRSRPREGEREAERKSQVRSRNASDTL